jgi:hypothetical protein
VNKRKRVASRTRKETGPVTSAQLKAKQGMATAVRETSLRM